MCSLWSYFTFRFYFSFVALALASDLPYSSQVCLIDISLDLFPVSFLSSHHGTFFSSYFFSSKMISMSHT